MVSFVWGPGQKTPIHDHTVWGLVGMLRGAERCRLYERAADGQVRARGERADAEARRHRGRVADGGRHRTPSPMRSPTRPRSASTSMAPTSAPCAGTCSMPRPGPRRISSPATRAPACPTCGTARPRCGPRSREPCAARWRGHPLARSPGARQRAFRGGRGEHVGFPRRRHCRRERAHRWSSADGASTSAPVSTFPTSKARPTRPCAAASCVSRRCLQAVWHAPVRTVAFATGRAWGAGADLFASCDIRACAPDTTLRFPGSAFGIVLGTRRLAELIGWDRARPLTTEGATVDAAGALAISLATDIVTGDAEAWLAARCSPPVADRTAFATIRAACRPDHRAGDMASLDASASRPGLQSRIADYRAAVRSRAAKS